MALDPTALVTVAELKAAMGIGADSNNRNDALEIAINAASRGVQEFLGMKLCDAALQDPWTRTEFHTMSGSHILRVLDRPIVSILSIHEDATRAYGASTLLAEGTDYVLDKALGRVYRVQSGGGARPWQTGFEAIKLVGVLGYRDHKGLPTAAAPVPWDIKDVCLKSAARVYQENDKKQWDVSSITDATGSLTRVSASRLPPMMQEQLAQHVTWSATGRRAA